MNRLTTLLGGVALVALLLATGCVTHERLADDWLAEATATKASAPLGGEALIQRKLELDRGYRDVVHFQTSYASLKRRDDRGSEVLFGEFVDWTVHKHMLPLLEGQWQSRHPEVAVLDVNLRLAIAELWIEMGVGYLSERMIEEVERRYAGREEMMVASRLEGHRSLREGLEWLRQRLQQRSAWEG